MGQWWAGGSILVGGFIDDWISLKFQIFRFFGMFCEWFDA